VRPVLTEIHLRHACSCQEIEAGNAPPGRRRQALVASIVDSAVVAAHEAEHTAGWVLGLALERALDIGAEPQVRTRDTFTHRNGVRFRRGGVCMVIWAGMVWRGVE
jgi:hypothetical protein